MIYRFTICCKTRLASQIPSPIYDDKNILLGSFVANQIGPTEFFLTSFVSGESPVMLKVSSGQPFYFRPNFLGTALLSATLLEVPTEGCYEVKAVTDDFGRLI